jgi:hypothetical protein
LSVPVIFKVLFEREVRKIAVFFSGQDSKLSEAAFSNPKGAPVEGRGFDLQDYLIVRDLENQIVRITSSKDN